VVVVVVVVVVARGCVVVLLGICVVVLGGGLVVGMLAVVLADCAVLVVVVDALVVVAPVSGTCGVVVGMYVVAVELQLPPLLLPATGRDPSNGVSLPRSISMLATSMVRSAVGNVKPRSSTAAASTPPYASLCTTEAAAWTAALSALTSTMISIPPLDKRRLPGVDE